MLLLPLLPLLLTVDFVADPARAAGFLPAESVLLVVLFCFAPVLGLSRALSSVEVASEEREVARCCLLPTIFTHGVPVVGFGWGVADDIFCCNLPFSLFLFYFF